MLYFCYFNTRLRDREENLRASTQYTPLASFAPCCQERSNNDICAALDDVCYADRLSATALGTLRLSLLFLDCNYAVKGSFHSPSLKNYLGINADTRTERAGRTKYFFFTRPAGDWLRLQTKQERVYRLLIPRSTNNAFNERNSNNDSDYRE